VNTNATNIANINQNAANITAIQNASANATAAAASATSASGSATAAAASAAAASAVVLGNEPVRPAIRPSLLLDFANTKALDPRITFTRASTATFYGTQTAKAEENLLVQSQDFTTTWATQGITTTANTSTAPDGTTTADTITETTANSAHRTEQTVATSGTVTLSVFAKPGSGTRFLTIGVSRDATHASSATFDLSLGTNTQTRADGGVYSSASATITSVAQGFYRCTLTVTTDTCNTARVGLNDTGTPTSGNRAFGAGYTGDGTSSLILWGAQLEQRSAVTAYTPTTTQPITNYIPQLLTAASGVARFDHNPTTFESLGLEIEEQRTNLFTYSEQFSDAAWTKGLSSITANTIIAPDGALTGDKLVEDTSNGSHLIRQSVTGLTSGSTLTLSVYLKAAERTTAQIYFNDNASTANRVQADFNLSSGTTSSATNFGTFTGASSSITSVGNGWYRCTISGVAVGVTAVGNRVIIGTTTYTGDGYSGIYIWGAQLEAGAFATSYIQTVASQVTRAADVASMTGTNFSSWYNAGEGTLYGEYANSVTPAGGVARRISHVSDGTDSNRIYIAWGETTARALLVCTANGVSQASISGTAMSASGGKLAGAYKVNDFAVSANGLLTGTDTDGIIPSVNVLHIGTSAVGTSSHYLNGCVKKIAYYPKRIANAELQGVTTV
jgi:hypothetical protein